MPFFKHEREWKITLDGIHTTHKQLHLDLQIPMSPGDILASLLVMEELYNLYEKIEEDTTHYELTIEDASLLVGMYTSFHRRLHMALSTPHAVIVEFTDEVAKEDQITILGELMDVSLTLRWRCLRHLVSLGVDVSAELAKDMTYTTAEA